MADDQSEEFRRFILENREIIEKILNEGKEDSKTRKDEIKENIGEHIDETKEKAKAASESLLTVVTDENVQKHFITACLEFLHFVEAVIEAAPLSPEVREAVNRCQDARDDTLRNIVAVGAQDRMDNLKFEETESASKSTPKKKSSSIPINDLSDSSKKKKKTE